MKNTYETLKPYAAEVANLTDVEVVQAYRNGRINTNAALSALYCRHYGLFRKVCSKFSHYFDSSDQASFTLEAITKALNDYDENKATGKVNSYLARYVGTRIANEYDYITCKSRDWYYSDKSMMIGFSTDEEHGGDPFDIFGQSKDSYTFEMDKSIDTFQLSENQLKYCKLILEQGEMKDTEASTILGISKQAVGKMKKALKLKLAELAY